MVVAGSLVSPLAYCADICGVGRLVAVLGNSDARVVHEVPPRLLEVVPATVVFTVVVVAVVKLRAFCTGRGLCSDRLPGAVEKSLLCWLNTGRRFGQAVVVGPVVDVVFAGYLVVVVVVAVVVGVVVAIIRNVDCLVGWRSVPSPNGAEHVPCR